MTVEHIIFIPGALLVGATFGFLFGARAVRKEMARLKERSKK